MNIGNGCKLECPQVIISSDSISRGQFLYDCSVESGLGGRSVWASIEITLTACLKKLIHL